MQGVADPTILPIIAQGADAATHIAILEQLVLLVQAATAEAASAFELANPGAKVVYYNAQ